MSLWMIFMPCRCLRPALISFNARFLSNTLASWTCCVGDSIRSARLAWHRSSAMYRKLSRRSWQ